MSATGLTRLRGRLRSLVPVSDGGFTCHAPSGSLYLDQHGDVRACCQNAGFALGNVTRSSLREIWDGARAQQLRSAVDDGDLSLGCNFCQWQVTDGDESAVFARTFDHLDPDHRAPMWPQQLELSMSNACNLQCVMCNGDWSSAIRTHREGRPPLPTVYDDAFFDELADFLPHLKVVKLLGGEPFLGAESLRVLEMLADAGSQIPVHITTNGTQLSPRIERILDRLNVHVVVSLDGVTPSTYEAIRVGASLDDVVAHIDRFVEYSRTKGTSFSLSHCLMTSNVDEFDEFLRFAERRECSVWVNTVTEPYDASVYHLPPSELRRVVADLAGRQSAVREELSGRRRQVWDEQLHRLRAHLGMLEEHAPPDYIAKRRQLGFAWLAPTERAADAQRRLIDSGSAAEQSAVLAELDLESVVTDVRMVGQHNESTDRLLATLQVGHRAPAWTTDPTAIDDGSVLTDDLTTHRSALDAVGDHSLSVAVRRAAVRDADGIVTAARLFVSPVSIAVPGLVEDSESADRGERSSAADPVADPDERTDTALLVPSRPDALVAAEQFARDGATVQGFSLDPDGRIAAFDDDATELFGAPVADLVGGSVGELREALSVALGAPVGPLEQIESTPPIQHHRQRFESDGRERELHSFAQPSGHGSRVWLTCHEASPTPR